ncbi:MAG: hypothetical protein WAL30_00855 [Candidatus Aquirickettsiella sp.]
MPAEKPGLYDNFTLRGESYTAGMLLLIKYLTEPEWQSGNKFSGRLKLISERIAKVEQGYLDDLKEKSKASFEAAKEHLNTRLFAPYSLMLLSDTTLQVPFQSLCVAERCAVWKKGRRTLVTPVSFVGEDSRLESLKVAQSKVAQSETPYTDNGILLQEYSAASKTFWFESLPKWQQDFIKKNAEELSKQSIPSSLRSVPGLANLSMHHCQLDGVDILSYWRHATQAPIDLMADKQAGDELFRLTCLNLASQIRVSIEKKANALDSTSELVILTQSILSPGLIASLKAKLISDASDNDTQIYKLKEKAVKLFQHALANPDALIQDAKIKVLFFTSEAQQKALSYKDFLEKWELIAQGNKTYKYKKSKPVKLTLLSSNHPFNVLRHFGTYTPQTVNNEVNTALLMGAIARYLTPLLLKTTKQSESGWQPERWTQLEEDLKFSYFSAKLNKLINELNCCEKSQNLSDNSRKSLAETLENFVNFVKEQDVNKDVKNKFLEEIDLQLLHALQALLSIPSGQGVLAFDKRHKPQLRSTAETIIVDRMGGAAWVACKSGKDRTGGAVNAIDAAVIFYALQGRYPRYDDGKQDRALYLEILKSLFESGHQQKAASENAPGAEGLVKPDNFSPADLKLKRNGIRLETQLARLNKPKKVKISPKESFNYTILKDALQSSKDKTINVTMGQNVTLEDWRRNWEIYFINGKSVKELREGKEFKDEKDLSEFIETYLLAQIEDQASKKYYLALALGSFHQGGFLHAFSAVSMELINECYGRQKQEEQKAIIGQPKMEINLSWVKGKGIQIEEINAYTEKKYYNRAEPLETGDYCDTRSCILLSLNAVKDKGYKLAVHIQSADVNCNEAQLKSVFFSKKSNVLEAFIHFLQSLLVAIKRYFDKLVKPDPVLDDSWISKTNATFFKKSPPAITKNKEINAQGDVSLSPMSNK